MTGLPVSNAPTGIQVFWLIAIILAGAATRHPPPPRHAAGGGLPETEPAQ